MNVDSTAKRGLATLSLLLALCTRCLVHSRRGLAYALLAVLASACVSGDSDSAVAPVAATEGCASASAEAGREVNLTVGNQTRTALLHVPESVDPGMPPPLVLVFHGFAGSPVAMEVGSDMSEKADEAGFVAVYPEGTGFSPQWDLVGADDTEFVDRLLTTLEGEVCFDPRRVYASGFSMGGGMANIVACRLAGRIAGLASVSGVYLPTHSESCMPSRPVPVIAFHGKLDDVLPYDGGTAPGTYHEVIGVEDWAVDWADRNGCAEGPERQPAISEAVEPLFWIGCAAPVELYPVANRGHTWPGSPLDVSPETMDDISATDLIWDFFARQSLPAQ